MLRLSCSLRHAWAAATLALLATAPALAQAPLVGSKALKARLGDGSQVVLGTVVFTPGEGGRTGFALTLDHKALSDHFLSMREFKCLSGTGEITCHVPYPYANPRSIQGQDYRWLEHSLLFFYKAPRDFGAKLWNGLYFEFQPQGAALVGTPKAVDLDQISAPPADLGTPPFGRDLRHDIPADTRWVRALVIE